MSSPPRVVLLAENRHLIYLYERLIVAAGAQAIVIDHLLALKKWTQTNPTPQAVLADLHLTEKLLEILRAHASWQHIPLLMMVPPKYVFHGHAHPGPFNQIEKPFDPQKLIITLRQRISPLTGVPHVA